MPDLNALAIHFAPELILTVGALLVLAYDMLIGGREGRQAWLAALSLLLALVASGWLLTVPAPAAGIFETRNASGAVVASGTFAPDSFTGFFRLVSQLSALLVLVTSLRFMKSRTPYRGEFMALLLFAALAIDLAAGANDLIVMALAIEFVSVTGYVLTGYLKHDALSVEGALKYFLYGSVAGATMLMGLVWLYGTTGTTSLPEVAAGLRPAAGEAASLSPVAQAALLLVLVGMGFKVALVPFHQWSPDAYHGAPTPVTAFLSVGPKAAGLAVVSRFLLTAFSGRPLADGWLSVLAALAAITMVVGNVSALTQRNVKRMMAYSSIAQAGYMLVGLVSVAGARFAGVPPLAALLLYILAYLFSNLGAFAVVVAVDDEAGSSELEAFAGLMQRSPLLASSLFVFLLSLIGIPPLAGFFGKFAVFSAAVASGQAWLAVVGVLTGVLSVGYYFRLARQVLFVSASDQPRLRAAPGLLFVTVLSLVMVFAIGMLAGPFLDLATQAASGLAGSLSPAWAEALSSL